MNATSLTRKGGGIRILLLVDNIHTLFSSERKEIFFKLKKKTQINRKNSCRKNNTQKKKKKQTLKIRKKIKKKFLQLLSPSFYAIYCLRMWEIMLLHSFLFFNGNYSHISSCLSFLKESKKVFFQQESTSATNN